MVVIWYLPFFEAEDGIREDRQWRAGTHCRGGGVPLTLAPLLSGDVLVDVEPPPALARAPAATSTTRKRRGLEGRRAGCGRARIDAAHDRALLVTSPQLGRAEPAPPGFLRGLGERSVHDHAVALLNLDEHVEGRW